jgi:hypothetical protein
LNLHMGPISTIASSLHIAAYKGAAPLEAVSAMLIWLQQ